jgi:hypothetical protein
MNLTDFHSDPSILFYRSLRSLPARAKLWPVRATPTGLSQLRLHAT